MSEQDWRLYGHFIVRLVALAKNYGIGIKGLLADSDEAWFDLMDRHDLLAMVRSRNAFDEARAIELAREVFVESAKQTRRIDFDDMLFIAAKYGVAFKQFDVVFVDEAQDLSAIQHMLLKRMVKQNGKVIAVGDSRQAIYGFRGADSDSMANLQASFNAVSLPLNICYRCSKAVIEYVKSTVCPEIEASPSALVGSVTTLDRYGVDTFKPMDAILCRNTKPLIDLAYWFIRNGKAVKVLGREIGQGLVALVNKMKAASIEDLENALTEYQDRETKRLSAKHQQDLAVQALEDKVSCIYCFIDKLDKSNWTIQGLVESIEALFTDNSDEGKLTLATIHRSKGLEFPNVYILDPSLMPSKHATQEWQKIQENNLRYVAYTRAIENLVFIAGGAGKMDNPAPIV